MVDGKVVDTRAVYLCTNAMCAEKIRLNGHRLSQADMDAAAKGVMHAPS